MNDKELTEYSQWIIEDTLKQVGLAAVIYAVALGLYWSLIG